MENEATIKLKISLSDLKRRELLSGKIDNLDTKIYLAGLAWYEKEIREKERQED